MAAYLSAEVLGTLTPDVVEFLTRTSIASGLSPGLCNELTGRGDSGQVLEAIRRDNLFLMPLDDDGSQYRYHHVFGSFCRRSSSVANPRGGPRSPSARGALVRARGPGTRSVAPLLRRGRSGRRGRLVTRRWWPRYLTGRVWTARRWVDTFSGDQLEDYPALTVAAAWIFALTERPDLARSLLSGFDPAALDRLPVVDRAASPRSSFSLVRALLAADGPFQMRGRP